MPRDSGPAGEDGGTGTDPNKAGMQPLAPTADDVRWWLDTDRVRGFVLGVFEGGGTKGVLYAGALQGVLNRELWFSAVAGSSAGAITAAMIAGGMSPSDIRRETDRGLLTMALPTALSALRRVRWGTGFLNQESVLEWLREILSHRCRAAGLDVDATGPTFEQLFSLTGIELFVAAVDLKARHLTIFSHTLTPKCSVSDAVMASATIPLAFEPLVLHSTVEGSPKWRLFVDGGVASNYPAFVFQDEAFRRYAGLPPVPSDAPVVGFLLDEKSPESRDETLQVYRDGIFIGPYFDGLALLAQIVRDTWKQSGAGPDAHRGVKGEPLEEVEVPTAPGRPRFRPRFSDPHGRHGTFRSLGRSMGSVIGLADIAVIKPMTWLALAFQRDRRRLDAAWNWKDPKGRHARLWVVGLRRWLTTSIIPFGAGLVAYSAIFWIGFVIVARLAWPDVANTSILGIVIGILVTLAALILAVWMWLLGLIAFLCMRFLYTSIGVLGPDVLRTYLDTSAPPWVGLGPNEHLVRLAVPKGVTTLGIEPGTDVDTMLDEAERIAFDSLAAVTGRPPAR